MTVPDLHAESDRHAAITRFEELKRGQSHFGRRPSHATEDGTPFYADITGGPVHLPQGDCVFAIFRDISDCKRADATLRETQSLLVQTERLGRSAAGLSTSRRETDLDGYGLRDSRSGSQLSADRGRWHRILHTCLATIISQAVQRAIEHGYLFDLELEIITAKGNLRSVHAIGRADLARRTVSGFFQDITESRSASRRRSGKASTVSASCPSRCLN